jgi:hypothetical protein
MFHLRQHHVKLLRNVLSAFWSIFKWKMSGHSSLYLYCTVPAHVSIFLEFPFFVTQFFSRNSKQRKFPVEPFRATKSKHEILFREMKKQAKGKVKGKRTGKVGGRSKGRWGEDKGEEEEAEDAAEDEAEGEGEGTSEG